MGRHDQLFKRLFEAFLGDLLRLVAPGIAQRLRTGEAELLPQEYFAGRPDGRRRELDLVARVPTAEGETEAILVAVEAEARARASMGRRLWEYASLLGIHHAAPVLPVVVYLRGGAPDVTRRAYLQTLFGEELAHFFYYAFGLSRSRAEQYLRRPEPLAWALAALMHPGSWTPSRHKIECLRRIAGAALDDGRRVLLIDCVETYIELNGEEVARFEATLAEEANREVQAMEMTWSEKLEHKGVERGRQEGREQGRQEGREQGRHEGREQGRQEGREQGRQEGMRSLLLGLMENRFGPLPAGARRKLEAVDSAEELSRLAARVLEATSLEEMGLA